MGLINKPFQRISKCTSCHEHKDIKEFGSNPCKEILLRDPQDWVKEIYRFALMAAANDPYSSLTRLFLNELYITERFAYDSCCEVIATEIIGG